MIVDMTHKITTLREATAIAVVRTSSEETIKAIRENRVPKGNVFEMAKAAGLLGVKKTPELFRTVIRCLSNIPELNTKLRDSRSRFRVGLRRSIRPS